MKITKISVPFPIEYGYGRATNAYLIEGETKALVDTGIDSESNRKFIKRELEKAGALDLNFILLTHGHLDHYSLGTYIQSETGATMMIHELDSPMLEDYIGHYFSWFCELRDQAIEGGFDPGLLEEARIKLMTAASMLFKTAIFEKFNEINLECGALRSVHLPGHTEGSVGIAIGDSVISGDVAIEGSTVVTDLRQEFESLEKLKVFSKIYAGHERTPLLRGDIDSLEGHFISRLEEVLRATRKGATLKEIVVTLYRGSALENQPYKLILPINQTVAYLRYLEAEGLVEKRGKRWISFKDSLSTR
ncbi:MAG: MBL fold metallo-hydrolase [Candidatus Verstraetearchaeota archaeon]|nr:MBL fold metallo-hydrolase [Candidatus Verstraetearchaeota archaeon]